MRRRSLVSSYCLLSFFNQLFLIHVQCMTSKPTTTRREPFPPVLLLRARVPLGGLAWTGFPTIPAAHTSGTGLQLWELYLSFVSTKPLLTLLHVRVLNFCLIFSPSSLIAKVSAPLAVKDPRLLCRTPPNHDCRNLSVRCPLRSHAATVILREPVDSGDNNK
jgi:hypothetical protein